MDNQFDSTGGEQNVGQGKGAIGQQNNYGIPPEVFAGYVSKLAVTESALASFFKILEEQQIPRGDLDSKLREIAFRYKELLLRFEAVTSDDPQVQALKEQAKQAIENGEYDRADELLDQIDERHDNAIHQLHKLQAETAARLEKEQLGKAENLVSKAKLQRLQYRYEKSAQYFQEAASALPEGCKLERADYFSAAAYDLYCIAHYAEALRLCEQGLSIEREINDLKGEAKSLNTISQIYQVQGEYGKALDYLKSSLTICRKIGYEEIEGAILHNISLIHLAKGSYMTALRYLEQSLVLAEKTNDKKGKGSILRKIGQIYSRQGNYTSALKYYKQALAISRNVNDLYERSVTLNDISQVYHEQGIYDTAWEYLEQSLVITRQISNRRMEGTILNNLARIHKAKGNYPAALKQYEQSLIIRMDIGDKEGEAITSWNIGLLYIQQEELAKAEPYLSRAVELEEQLEHPDLKSDRETLAAVRSKLRGNGARQ